MSYIKKEKLQEKMETAQRWKPVSKHLHSSSNGGKGKRKVPVDTREFLTFFLWI